MFFDGAWIFGGWGVVDWGRKSCLGLAEILSFSSRFFSHLNQIWFKCETPLLFFLITFIEYRNSHPQMFFKIGVPQACNFTKKRLQGRCFPVKLVTFLRTLFFKEHLQWLLLCILYIHDVIHNLSRRNKGYNDIYKKDQ